MTRNELMSTPYDQRWYVNLGFIRPGGSHT